MEEVMSNPQLGTPIISKLGDARWQGFQKMQYVRAIYDKFGRVHKVSVHYVARFENGIINAIDDFKITSNKF
jgi:hypothetical protein